MAEEDEVKSNVDEFESWFSKSQNNFHNTFPKNERTEVLNGDTSFNDEEENDLSDLARQALENNSEVSDEMTVAMDSIEMSKENEDEQPQSDVSLDDTEEITDVSIVEENNEPDYSEENTESYSEESYVPSEENSEPSEESSDDTSYSNMDYEDIKNNTDGVLNVHDEALEYANKGGIFDLLNDGSEEEKPEINEEFQNKTDFRKLNNLDKKPFISPILNKSRMLYALSGCFVILLICFYAQSFAKEKKKKNKPAKDNTVQVAGYNPDFGNYMERRYQNPQADENAEQAQKIDEFFENLPKEDNKKNEEPKTVYYTQNTSSQAPQNTERDKAVKSSIRMICEGVGSPNGYYPMGQNASYNGYPPSMNDNPIYPYNDNGYGGGSSSSYYGGGNPPSYNGGGSSSSNTPYMTKDDYMASYLNTQEKVAKLMNISDNKGYGGDNGRYERINNGRYTNNGAYDSSAGGGDYAYLPPNSLYPGTIIHAVMVNGINTDYPGTITARIIQNVYDSRTGTKLLIPQGSILRGSYSSSSIGINKVQIAWQTLVINRGGVDYLVNLGSMVGIDKEGYSGIKGTLSEHAFQYLKAMGMSSLFTYMNSQIYTYTNAQKSATTRNIIAGNQEILNKLTDKLLDRALDIQPTVKVKPGTRVSVDVDKVLTLPVVDRDMPKKEYIRK